MSVAAVLVHARDAAIQRLGTPGAERIVRATDQLRARGDLLVGLGQITLLGQHQIERKLILAAGGDACDAHGRIAS
jgi:hypothetical protein